MQPVGGTKQLSLCVKESDPCFSGRRFWWGDGRGKCKDVRGEGRGHQEGGGCRLEMNTWCKGQASLGEEEGTMALSGVVKQMVIMVWAQGFS